MPPHILECGSYRLQYDGVRIGMWNLCSPSGNGGNVCEELRKRMVDVCC